MGSVIRGKLGREDLNHWAGSDPTFTRPDATGSSVSRTPIGDEIDVYQVFGGGVGATRSVNLIQQAISAIGSNPATIVLDNGETWQIGGAITQDIPANITVRLPAGTIINVLQFSTLNIFGPLIMDQPGAITGLGTFNYGELNTGGGALTPAAGLNRLNTTGGGAFTLADGYEGQRKAIKFVVKDSGTDAVVTPTNLDGASTITFTDVGDIAYLVYTTGGWSKIGGDAFADTELIAGTLASTDNAKGASLVGIEDTAGNYDSTDLESLLAELVTKFGDTKYKTINQSKPSDITFANDDHLTGWPLTANAYYEITAWIHGVENGGNLKTQYVFSQTPQSGNITIRLVQTGGTDLDKHLGGVLTNVVTLGGFVGNEQFGMHITGYFQAHASTGGTLDFQWAQVSSNANATTLNKGSWMKIRRMS